MMGTTVWYQIAGQWRRQSFFSADNAESFRQKVGGQYNDPATAKPVTKRVRKPRAKKEAASAK